MLFENIATSNKHTDRHTYLSRDLLARSIQIQRRSLLLHLAKRSDWWGRMNRPSYFGSKSRNKQRYAYLKLFSDLKWRQKSDYLHWGDGCTRFWSQEQRWANQHLTSPQHRLDYKRMTSHTHTHVPLQRSFGVEDADPEKIFVTATCKMQRLMRTNEQTKLFRLQILIQSCHHIVWSAAKNTWNIINRNIIQTK